jgi:hypothetical protein
VADLTGVGIQDRKIAKMVGQVMQEGNNSDK